MNGDILRMDIRKNTTTGVKQYKNGLEKAVFTDKDYLLPIPQDEMDKNELFVQTQAIIDSKKTRDC